MVNGKANETPWSNANELSVPGTVVARMRKTTKITDCVAGPRAKGRS